MEFGKAKKAVSRRRKQKTRTYMYAEQIGLSRGRESLW